MMEEAITFEGLVEPADRQGLRRERRLVMKKIVMMVMIMERQRVWPSLIHDCGRMKAVRSVNLDRN
jgi:hypothetical protein